MAQGNLTDEEWAELQQLRQASAESEARTQARIEVRDEMLRIQKENAQLTRRVSELTEDNRQLAIMLRYLLKEYETHITRRVWEDVDRVIRLHGVGQKGA